MIQALLAYAEATGLASRPGYTKKQVKWVLQFDDSVSAYTGLVPSDKVFPGAPDLSQPELKTLGARYGEAAHFLVATLATWLAWAKDPQEEPREARRRSTLMSMLEQAGGTCPRLFSLWQLLSDESVHAKMLGQTEGALPRPKPTDLATVAFGAYFPVEDDCWQVWWDSFRASLSRGIKNKGKMVSFATGELIDPESTHPKVTKLSGVGLSQPHAPIVTFDKPAFESYNLGQGANAAMDADSAKAYVTALDDLLDKSVIHSWRRPKPNKPKELAKDFARLGGARLVYWYAGTEEAITVAKDVDPLALVFGSVPPREEPTEDAALERRLAEERLRSCLDRVKSGKSTIPIGDVRFYVIALSGAGGRVMTRDFLESSLLDLANATENWFEDLSLVGWMGAPGPHPKLEEVLTCPLRPKGDQDYMKWVTPVGAWRQQLWRAALLGTRIPEVAVSKALLAHTFAVVSGDLTDPDKGPRARALARRRLALVKAHLLRKTTGVSMQSALDPEHPSPAYHCGRLLSVYDNVQRAALGDVGAGVVQRNYGGAIINPAGVLGRLSTLVTKHLDKLGGGLGFTYETKIAEIHNGIKGAYPSALDQEGQALFALGFWHQTAFDNAEIIKNTAAKKAREKASAHTAPAQTALIEEE